MQLWPLWPARELNWYGLAVAHATRGQIEEARRWFDQAEETINLKLRLAAEDRTVSADYAVLEILEAKVLRREVSQLLNREAASAQ
jgi:hypothetical protein